MTLTANAEGKIRGTFTIPPDIPSGSKTVRIEGTATQGQGVFTGSGELVINTYQQNTRIDTVTKNVFTQVWPAPVDPLAQTFTMNRHAQMAGTELWFTACGGDVRVQVRETQNGTPTRRVLIETVVPQATARTDGQPTRVNFAAPLPLLAGEEYALVILADEAISALAVAELGKFDATAQKWVTSQPYTIGVLLSSSNASTWTAHQDKDLTFRLLEAVFTPAPRMLDLGTVTVANATDMLLLGLAQTPTAQTRVEYGLTLPGGAELTLAAGQAARFAAAVSGEVKVTARLAGEEKASPVLWPGTQLISGTVGQSGEYYSRSIPATGATKAVLVYDAVIPSGATVTARIRKDDGSWVALSADGTTQQGDGLVEYRWKSTLSNVNEVKIKLTLTGTSTARPQIRNIRLMAVM